MSLSTGIVTVALSFFSWINWHDTIVCLCGTVHCGYILQQESEQVNRKCPLVTVLQHSTPTPSGVARIWREGGTARTHGFLIMSSCSSLHFYNTNCRAEMNKQLSLTSSQFQTSWDAVTATWIIRFTQFTLMPSDGSWQECQNDQQFVLCQSAVQRPVQCCRR